MRRQPRRHSRMGRRKRVWPPELIVETLLLLLLLRLRRGQLPW